MQWKRHRLPHYANKFDFMQVFCSFTVLQSISSHRGYKLRPCTAGFFYRGRNAVCVFSNNRTAESSFAADKTPRPRRVHLCCIELEEKLVIAHSVSSDIFWTGLTILYCFDFHDHSPYMKIWAYTTHCQTYFSASQLISLKKNKLQK